MAMTKKLLLVALGIGVLIGVGYATNLLGTHKPGPRVPAPEPPPPPTADELALVAPLAPGAPLEDYTIAEIYRVDPGVMRVLCTKDAGRVQLDISLAGDGRAPVNIGPYAIFYAIDKAPDADGQRLAKALAAKIH